MPKRPLQDLQITCPGPRNKTYIIYIPIPKHVADSVKRTKKPRAAEPEKLITNRYASYYKHKSCFLFFNEIIIINKYINKR